MENLAGRDEAQLDPWADASALRKDAGRSISADFGRGVEFATRTKLGECDVS